MAETPIGESWSSKVRPGMYIGYGLLLASAPTTSAVEVAVSTDILEKGLLGWYDQVAFVLCFMVGMVAFGAFSNRLTSMFSPGWILFASAFSAIAGVLAYAFSAVFDWGSGWMILGSMVRGLANAGLMLGWLELFVDLTPRVRHVSIALPLALLAAALVAGAIWALTVWAGAVVAFAALAVLPAASYLLLLKAKSLLEQDGIAHLNSVYRLKMPRSTKLIIFVFGVSLGCIWAVFYSISNINLPFLACAAFLVLALVLVLGLRAFVRRELAFGFALRWCSLFPVAGFLALPVFVQQFPDAVAFMLAFAWASQMLLFALMPVQIASTLPVSMLSVASGGSVPFGLGTASGTLAAGAALVILGTNPYAYSVITAIACLSLTAASLFFPSRSADASVFGMERAPENELHAQRIARRCGEVAGKWGLTARECEVANLMALGKTRRQIADELSISEETVKTHGKHIYEKLDVHSLRELVALIENGTL